MQVAPVAMDLDQHADHDNDAAAVLAANVNHGRGAGGVLAMGATPSTPQLEVTISTTGHVLVGDTVWCHVFQCFRVLSEQYACDAMLDIPSVLVGRIDAQNEATNKALAPLMPILASGVNPTTLKEAGEQFTTAMIDDDNRSIFVDVVKTHLLCIPALLAVDQTYKEHYELHPT